METKILVSWLLILIGTSCSDTKKVQSKEIDITKQLDSLIVQLIESEELIGAELYLLQDGTSEFHQVYGYTSTTKERKIQKNDIWAVKSMTKPVTATAILMLHDDGLLSLDDPVTKYIPSYQGYELATIRNLLLQNSGDDGSHGNRNENIFDFNTQADWVLDWASQPAKGTFGAYEYSNFNYEALGYIVSQVSKQPVEVFIETRIIQPLGLTDTHTFYSPETEWARNVPNRYRVSEENKPELIQTNLDKQPWAFFPASFGLWMSNKDFATFLQMWMNGGKYNGQQILKEETIKEALQIGVWISEEDMAGQGLGWQIEMEPYIYYKGGADGSIGIAYPEKKLILVFMTHMQGGKHTGKIWDILGEHIFGWD